MAFLDSGRSSIAVGPAVMIAFLAAAFSAPPAVSDTCPTNQMQFRGLGVFTSSAAAFDSSYSSFGEFRVGYDLVAGTMRLHHCCSLGLTYVDAGDAYDVVGVPSGTPVTLTAELTADGEVFDGGRCGGGGCSGTFGSSLRHGADYQETVHSPTLFAGAHFAFHDVTSIPVTIVAGRPEEIRFRYWGTRPLGSSHGADATGLIRFTGLAPGVSIVSCYGYTGSATSTHRTTWGSIKTIYR